MSFLAVSLSSLLANAAALFYIPSKPLLEDPVVCLQTTTAVLFIANLVVGLVRYEARQENSSLSAKAATVSLATGATIAGTVVIHTFAILFGAPLIEKFRNTFMFALYVSLLTVFPATCVLRADPDAWLRVFAEHRPTSRAEKSIYFPTIFTIFGAWLGAIVIPLDWDRPWQAWPISCVISAFLGHSLGLVAGTIASYLHVDEDSKKAGKMRSE
ncbi:GPI biosynthesis protein Pig-F [Jimgerdemannia flammicorona]|uniref:GPI biosynthesis protein Pig-F n=1 Tax=Jimgerdemannia flammicorona TaxID=994334 RepID=A0A433DJS2_9FUNG|nr:GPI biosynthesis protein Pig-F [Jimgerdemannia flammicorona]